MKLKPKTNKRVINQFLKDFLDNNELKEKEEKVIRCERFASQKDIPACFVEQNYKDKLIFEYIQKFEENFLKENPERKLLLYPKNENLIEKFIFTTIRPTKLGYKEMNNYQDCMKYLSNFIK